MQPLVLSCTLSDCGRGHGQLFDRFGLGMFLDLVLFLLINFL
jgi:hypothetical protein